MRGGSVEVPENLPAKGRSHRRRHWLTGVSPLCPAVPADDGGPDGTLDENPAKPWVVTDSCAEPQKPIMDVADHGGYRRCRSLVGFESCEPLESFPSIIFSAESSVGLSEGIQVVWITRIECARTLERHKRLAISSQSAIGL